MKEERPLTDGERNAGQLWRGLYLRTYASPSVRRSAALGGPVARSRPWRELYQISTNWRNGSARATTLATRNLRRAVLPPAPVAGGDEEELLRASRSHGRSGSTPPREEEDDDDTLIQFHRQFLLTASRADLHPDDDDEDAWYPSVTVHQTLPGGGSTVLGSFGSDRLRGFYAERAREVRPASLRLTEMCIDGGASAHDRGEEEQGTTALLVALFYSTGQYALFRLALPSSPSASDGDGDRFRAEEVFTSLATGLAPHYHVPTPIPTPTRHRIAHGSSLDPVVHARLHWPLLFTLTESLTLRFLRLSDAGADADAKRGPGGRRVLVDETETPLQSGERWAPVVLTLTPAGPRPVGADPSDSAGGDCPSLFRAALAYSTPVFPASWTVGLQLFEVAVPPASSPRAHASPPLSVTARHVTALPAQMPLPTTPRRSAPLAASGGEAPLRAMAGPAQASPVTSIEYAHPFVVTSRVDNTIDVYEVLESPSRADEGAGRTQSRRGPRSSTTAMFPAVYRLAGAGVGAGAARAESSSAAAGGKHSAPLTSLELVHCRTLFGHTARVASVALLPAIRPPEEEEEPSAAARAAAAARGGSSSSSSSARSGAPRQSGGTIRCVSAGDDGAVKVWHLSPSASSSSSSAAAAKRRRRSRPPSATDEDLDVSVRRAGLTAATEEEEGGRERGLGDWHRLKRRRTDRTQAQAQAQAGTTAPAAGGDLDEDDGDVVAVGARPRRVKRVWVDEDKILLLQQGPVAGGVTPSSRRVGDAGDEIQVLRFD